jgi:CubicO group peptidase (beta-lactamase class C family)
MRSYLGKKIFVIIMMIICLNAWFLSISTQGSSSLVHPLLVHKNPQTNDMIDAKIRLLMFAGYTPSLAACIIHNQSVVWSHGYGFYDFEGLKQPSNNTIYQVASVSKTMTATAILQLYEKGLFNLDDDVNEYLPFSLRNPHYPDISITFRMLLSHHSSLHDHNVSAAYEYFVGDYPYSYVEELLVPGGEAYHAEFWGNYPPGDGGNYSNLGFVVLGYLVELLSNQTLEQYCQQHIFIPLQMKNTSFEMDVLPVENLACSYLRIGRMYLKLPNVDYTFLDPCGGLLTTTDDLSHFLIAHMNKGKYQDVRILNETTIQMMHTIQYPESAPYLGVLKFGLGWLIFKEEFGRITHGHDGDLTFSHARMRIYDNNTTAIIYLFNKGVPLVQRVVPSLLESLSDVYIRGQLYQKASMLDL